MGIGDIALVGGSVAVVVALVYLFGGVVPEMPGAAAGWQAHASHDCVMDSVDTCTVQGAITVDEDTWAVLSLVPGQEHAVPENANRGTLVNGVFAGTVFVAVPEPDGSMSLPIDVPDFDEEGMLTVGTGLTFRLYHIEEDSCSGVSCEPTTWTCEDGVERQCRNKCTVAYGSCSACWPCGAG